MKPWRSGALIVALTALLGACTSVPRLTMPAGPVPDLRGTWRGTWGGTPLTLVVLEQQEASPSGGVVLGPWHVLGRDLPGVSGVLIFAVRGEPVSVNVRGQLGDLDGRLSLLLEPLTVDGGWIVVAPTAEHRMVGTGAAASRWEPQGPVELIRQAPPSPGAVPP